jgi:phage terminase large subunit
VAQQFLSAFGGQKHVDVVPVSKKSDQINAARAIIRKCEFHEPNCGDGLDGLREWQFEFNDDLQVFSKEPKHDKASHPSDAFAYGCQVMQFAPPPQEEVRGRVLQIGHHPPPNQVTLEDLWDQNERKTRRR